MTNIREELALLMGSLNAEKFRILIQSYLKERYNTSDVFITDGPYDGGNDLEIRINEKTIKKNIQITVQKGDIEKKLREDLEKANINVSKYSYVGKLDFYYNQKLTKLRIDELKLIAELEYEIDLAIYDSNILSQLNENYSSIKKNTLELLNISGGDDLIKIDKQTKILFDLLAMGNEAGEVKKQFIYSFIFTFLFEKPASTIEEIMTYVGGKLPDVQDLKFYRDSLSSLKGKGVVITDDSRKIFSLSNDKRNEISSVYEKALMQESVLKNLLYRILQKYNLENDSKEIVEFLYEAYKENYKIDIEELKQSSLSINSSIKRIYQDLQKFLQRRNLNAEQAQQLTSQIIDACNSDEYLNKIGASILFVNLYESNKLDDYINRSIQHYYFDTQALLRLFCYQYNNTPYDDVAFLSVSNLYETIKKFKDKIILNTSYDYLTEVAGHFQEALRLQRFLSLPIFRKFKTSKNLFYNFYIHLVDKGLIEESITLEEFVNEFLDMSTPQYNDVDFIRIVSLRLKEILEILNINVIYHPAYENFALLKREYEITLSHMDRYRSYSAIENDVRMIIYLADVKRHVDSELGLRSEPYLVTWDKVFYEFRKVIMARFKLSGYGYWYIYPPAKLADKLSVMNFKLNPASIDYNIISLTESNFNFNTTHSSFLDTISLFFNKEDISELKLATKLLELEDKSRNINEKPESEEISDENAPLVKILTEIKSQYSKPESKYKFNDLVNLFDENKYEAQIFTVLEKSVETYFSNSKSIDESVFANFDLLITQQMSENINLK